MSENWVVVAPNANFGTSEPAERARLDGGSFTSDRLFTPRLFSVSFSEP